MKLPLPEVKYLLRQSFCKDTSFTPDKWAPENPTYGHCAVAVLIAQDILGGEIRRGLLPKEWAEKLGYRSHYWNVGLEAKPNYFDITAEQFPKDFPYDDFINGMFEENPDLADKREYLLSNPETKKRYKILKERFEATLRSNPLYLDEKFQLCWETAFAGGPRCKKMVFACLVYDGNRLISWEVNRLMTERFGQPRFCAIDGSECIRVNIQSRMDATVGDCGHAPVWSLARVFELGYKPGDLPKLDFYEAGFRPDGSPWWRNEPSYSCTYCQNIFAIFGLDKIWGTCYNQWMPLRTQDSFYSSGKYALGEKKV